MVKNQKNIKNSLFRAVAFLGIVLLSCCYADGFDSEEEDDDQISQPVYRRKIITCVDEIPEFMCTLPSLTASSAEELERLVQEDHVGINLFKILLKREEEYDKRKETVKTVRFCLQSPYEQEISVLMNVSYNGWVFILQRDNNLFELIERSKFFYQPHEPAAYTAAVEALTKRSTSEVVFVFYRIIQEIAHFVQGIKEHDRPLPAAMANLEFLKELLRRYDHSHGFFYHLKRLEILNSVRNERIREKTKLSAQRSIKHNEVFEDVLSIVKTKIEEQEDKHFLLQSMAQLHDWLMQLEIADWPFFLHYNVANALEKLTVGITPVLKALHEEKIEEIALESKKKREERLEEVRHHEKELEQERAEEDRRAREVVESLAAKRIHRLEPLPVKTTPVEAVRQDPLPVVVPVAAEPLPVLQKRKKPLTPEEAKRKVQEDIRREMQRREAERQASLSSVSSSESDSERGFLPPVSYFLSKPLASDKPLKTLPQRRVPRLTLPATHETSSEEISSEDRMLDEEKRRSAQELENRLRREKTRSKKSSPVSEG